MSEGTECERRLNEDGSAEELPCEPVEIPMVGTGGTSVLHFRAVRPGRTMLKLVYRRSWEEGEEPLSTFSLWVAVR